MIRRLFIGLAAVLVLSGCVYLRLLELKSQIKSFDKNFTVSGHPELIIQFHNPILFTKDMRFLIGADPLSKKTLGNEKIWHYEFKIVRHSPPEKTPMEDLNLTLYFAKGKLSRFTVPETFLLLFSREVMTETMRLAGNSEVLETKRLVRAHMRLSPEADAKLPSREKTLSLMGKPLAVQQQEDLQTYIYRYRIVNDPNKVPIIARFGFSKDGKLRRVFVTWDTASVDVHYSRDKGDEKNQEK
ncbi:MAG: hypothetical protein HY548_09015 [Elusimicrobia bacterium]|nr:hypothetical protein [Elusimicrobiota bacterium]